jgi:hypothetical protein
MACSLIMYPTSLDRNKENTEILVRKTLLSLRIVHSPTLIYHVISVSVMPLLYQAQ